LLNRPNQIEQVLVTRQAEFVKYRFFWRHVTRVFGNGLLTSAGSLWQRQHALMAPAFRQERLALSVDKMVCCANRLFDRWQDGEERDIRADMTRLTLEIAAKVLFDVELDRAVAGISRAVDRGMEESPSASRGGCSFRTGSRRRETAAIWRLSEISMRPRRAYSRSDGLLVGIGRTCSRRCCKVGMPRGVQWTPGCFVMSWSRCSLQGTRRRRWR
jgi:cytochrome P450